MRPDFEEAMELIPAAISQDWRDAEASSPPVQTLSTPLLPSGRCAARVNSMQPAYRLRRALIRRLDGVFRDTACTPSSNNMLRSV